MAKRSNIRFWRGNYVDLPQIATAGMPLWCVDTRELFIGTGDGVVPAADVDTAAFATAEQGATANRLLSDQSSWNARYDGVNESAPAQLTNPDGSAPLSRPSTGTYTYTVQAVARGTGSKTGTIAEFVLGISAGDTTLNRLFAKSSGLNQPLFFIDDDGHPAITNYYDRAYTYDVQIHRGLSSVTPAGALVNIAREELGLQIESVQTTADSAVQPADLDLIRQRVAELDAAVVLAGAWDASGGAFPSGAQAGYTYIVSVAGSVDGVDFVANDRLLALVDGAGTIYANNWLKLDYSDLVLSVGGQTGVITELPLAMITGAGSAASADVEYLDADTLDGEHGAYYRDLSYSTGTLPGARLSGPYSIADRWSFAHGINMAAVAVQDAADLSEHLDLYDGNYGLSVQVPKTLNVVASTGAGDATVRLLAGRAVLATSFGTDHEIWHGGNTTVDSNGFLKKSSPITKLYADKLENSGGAEAEFTKLAIGHYQLIGTNGLAMEGWFIESPKDANGTIKVFIEYAQHPDHRIEVWTYQPSFDQGFAQAGAPMDIPAGRWIDIRLNETEVETVIPPPSAVPLAAAEKLTRWRDQSVVSKLQLIRAINGAGARDQFDAALDAADQDTRDGWDFASQINRNDALVAGFAGAVGYSDGQVDELFKTASQAS